MMTSRRSRATRSSTNTSASVPDVWVYTHPQNGVMRLLQEILRCCRIEGSLTALSTCCR